jgi:regulator of sigma E protease
MALIVFIIILSILVLIHEFGHFYAAKKTGVRVEEFGFGLPPRAIGKKIGETLYSLNYLPFGGFVKLSGEDIEEDDEGKIKKAEKDPKNFMSKTPNQKILIITAGVLMNLFLAIFLFYVLLIFTGFKSFTLPLFFDHNFRFGYQEGNGTVVMGLEEDSPAKNSGINVGESILEIAGNPVYNLSDIKRELDDKAGQQTSVLLMDMKSFDREIRTVSLTAIADEEGSGIIGVYVGRAVTLHYEDTKLTSGLMHAYNMISYSYRTFASLVKHSFATRDITPVSSTVAGPVGIFSIVGGILDDSQYPILSLIDLVALLSITLALINILPFPALDGGRLIFILFEKFFGKRINPKIELVIHKAGMVFLLAVLALVTIRDITRII